MVAAAAAAAAAMSPAPPVASIGQVLVPSWPPRDTTTEVLVSSTVESRRWSTAPSIGRDLIDVPSDHEWRRQLTFVVADGRLLNEPRGAGSWALISLRATTSCEAVGLFLWSGSQARARSLDRLSGQFLSSAGRSPSITTLWSFFLSRTETRQ